VWREQGLHELGDHAAPRLGQARQKVLPAGHVSRLDVSRISEEEKAAGYLEKNQSRLANGFYVSGVEGVKKNFSEWKNAIVVQGTIRIRSRRCRARPSRIFIWT